MGDSQAVVAGPKALQQIKLARGRKATSWNHHLDGDLGTRHILCKKLS